MADWKFYKEVNLSDEGVNQVHVDTRDFHCSVSDEKPKFGKDLDINLKKLLKHRPRFFYSPEETKEIIDRLFTESGGENEWRMLMLDGIGENASGNWGMKYIRIYRTDWGFLICNNKNRALNREVLSCKVNQEFLNAHTLKKQVSILNND